MQTKRVINIQKIWPTIALAAALALVSGVAVNGVLLGTSIHKQR
jgi:hypothetical protein